MKYEVTIDQDRQLIQARVWGELTVETVTNLTTEVGAIAAEHKLVRFVFDMRDATETVDVFEAFSLAANPDKRGLTRHHKRAIVYGSRKESYDFFENVSVNRGYDVKTFADMDRALEWIQED